MDPIIVTPVELKIFHSMDRDLYNTLAMHLWRDPLECMQVLGLWLLLERIGFGSIIQKVSALPIVLINEVADEALLCINYLLSLNFASSSSLNDIPLIRCLVDREISLQFFLKERSTMFQAFSEVVNEMCFKALGDLMHLAIQRNAAQRLLDQRNIANPSPVRRAFAPTGYYGLNVTPSSSVNEVPLDDRTVFVTFSKGYPVFEREVRDFFTKTYGDCIEAFHMQEVKNNEQALFARIVFNNSSIIDMILQGVDKAKFIINGKHVWARKFVSKRLRISVSDPPLPPLPLSPPLPPYPMSPPSPPPPPPPSPEA